MHGFIREMIEGAIQCEATSEAVYQLQRRHFVQKMKTKNLCNDLTITFRRLHSPSWSSGSAADARRRALSREKMDSREQCIAAG
jgi:hypothetical protein